jgi:RNA polymerase sigma-70 factor (ECF subfamily)
MKVGNYSEYTLIESIKAGNENAFKSLFFLYSVKLSLWAYKTTGDKQAAEDIVQDFFLQLWYKREQLCIDISFSSYAYRAIYNASLNYLRDHERYEYGVTLMGIPDEDGDDEADDELRIKLQKAIDELPEKCRKVFVMVTLEKKRHTEVAAHLGISINTVKVQVSKAYRIIRNKIGFFSFLQ